MQDSESGSHTDIKIIWLLSRSSTSNNTGELRRGLRRLEMSDTPQQGEDGGREDEGGRRKDKRVCVSTDECKDPFSLTGREGGIYRADKGRDRHGRNRRRR